MESWRGLIRSTRVRNRDGDNGVSRGVVCNCVWRTGYCRVAIPLGHVEFRDVTRVEWEKGD